MTILLWVILSRLQSKFILSGERSLNNEFVYLDAMGCNDSFQKICVDMTFIQITALMQCLFINKLIETNLQLSLISAEKETQRETGVIIWYSINNIDLMLSFLTMYSTKLPIFGFGPFLSQVS